MSSSFTLVSPPPCRRSAAFSRQQGACVAIRCSKHTLFRTTKHCTDAPIGNNLSFQVAGWRVAPLGKRTHSYGYRCFGVDISGLGLGLGLTLAGHFEHFPLFRRSEWTVPVWAYRCSVSFLAAGLVSTLYQHIVIHRHQLGEVPAIVNYAVAQRTQDGLMAPAIPVALMLFRRRKILAVWRRGKPVKLQFNCRSVVRRFAIGGRVVTWTPWVVDILFGGAYSGEAHTMFTYCSPDWFLRFQTT